MGVCPDDETVLAMAAGRLSDVPAALEAHLDACALCRELVIAAAVSDTTPFVGEAAGPVPEVTRLLPEPPDRYQTLGECGRGGQSRVFRVYDRELDREVALKEYTPRNREDGARVAETRRFLREVRVAGGLNHPGIVPVHEVGVRANGAPYYTMPLVKGDTLASVVRGTASVARRLRLLPHFVQVCQAIEHAHTRGVLHRDIKPDNIMVGPFGETLLLDWGLARVHGQDAPPRVGTRPVAEHSATGAAIGTPGFMSPEQAAGRGNDVDERSEVYSLGAVLFFVLSGRPPFAGARTTQVLERAARSEVVPLRASDGDIAPELAAIVRRAMARHPADRYPNAAALAADTVAFLGDGRVSAYDYSTRERATRFVRRHRALFLGTAAVFTTLVVALIVVARSYHRETSSRAAAEASLAAEVEARAYAERAEAAHRAQSLAAVFHLAGAYVEKAEHLRDEGLPLQANVFAAAALRYNPAHPGSPYFVPDAAGRFVDAPLVAARAKSLLLRAQHDAVEGIVDEATLPADGDVREVEHRPGKDFAFAVLDGTDTVQVHRLGGLDPAVRLAGHQGGAIGVALAPVGRFGVTRDSIQRLRLWDIGTGALVRSWSAPTTEDSAFAVSSRGEVAAIDSNGGLVLWPGDGSAPRHLYAACGPSGAIGFSRDGRRLAAGGRDGVMVWIDLEADDPVVHRQATHDGWIFGVEFGPFGDQLAVAGADGKVSVVHLASAAVTTLSGHRGSVVSVAFSADGRRLFTAAVDGMVRGFDIAQRRRLFAVSGPEGHLYEVAHAEQDDEVVVFGAHTIRRWKLRTPAEEGRHSTDPGARNFHPTRVGDAIIVPHSTREHALWLDPQTGRERAIPLPSGSLPLRVWVDASMGRWVTAHDNAEVVWWDESPDGLVPVHRRTTRGSVVSAFAVAEAGALVATSGPRGAIDLWRANDAPPQTLQRHTRTVQALAFSSDGRHLASAGFDGRVLVHSLHSGPVVELQVGQGAAFDVTFTRDAVVAAGEFGLSAWRVGSWEPWPMPEAAPQRLLVAEVDAPRIASLGLEGYLTLWDLEDHSRPLQMRRSRAPQGVAFARGGDALWILGRGSVERHPIASDTFAADANAIAEHAEQAAGMRAGGPETSG